MSLLTNPNELEENLYPSGLIYGQPGVGKSTLALSAPNPVLIDADKGMHRVEKRFQKTSLQIKSYREFIALLDSPELDPFDTIVTDTLGRFVDLIGDYVCEENPKNRQSDGTLALKGFGAVREEFKRMLRKAKSKKKYLLFVAHEKEEKEGDGRYMRPDVVGSSGKDLVKDLDYMGYMEMRGNKRTISFSPTEKYYAKNSLGLPAVMEVPEPKSAAENTFIQDHIIRKSMERMKADSEENKRYEDLRNNLMGFIETVTDSKMADEALSTIEMAPEIWDSKRVAKFHLNEKVKALGLTYDRDAKAFKAALQPAAPEPQAEAQAEGNAAATISSPPSEPAQANTSAPTAENNSEAPSGELNLNNAANKKATGKKDAA